MNDFERGLSLEFVRSVLAYDEQTGHFTWKETMSIRRKKGERAGSLTDDYRRIGLNEASYLEHRLAWFYVHGSWPAAHIDHVNCQRADNRIANLRDATRDQNLSNVSKYANNKSGFKGVHLHKASKLWAAMCRSKGKKYSAGYHKTPELAAAAYDALASQLHGDFHRPSLGANHENV